MSYYSKNKRIRVIGLLLLLLLAVAVTAPRIAAKADEGAKKIYTAEDMLKIADDSSADYILMSDIDMKDVTWKPVDFRGTFDGNGYAILNLKVTETSDNIRTTYDGNYKEYDTYFAGLFGILEGSTVKNLTLKGLDVEVTKDAPCFAGTIAGFAEDSNIENCDIEGTVRLDANSKCFGVGGIVGYGGKGAILETDTDITLICIDHDKENRDEQFLGGGYAAGYLDVDKCNIKIEGYDSDHGYVHNGGLVGMYILYPQGTVYEGYINNTYVEGIITFFEDNTDRRAYCKDFCGEVMQWTYEFVGCSSAFTPNEIFDYSKDLLPHDCSGDNYTSKVTEPTCDEFGYTEYSCNECNDYTYIADYTLKNHTVDEWSVISETPDEINYEKISLEEGKCSKCGATVYRQTRVAVEETTEEATADDKTDKTDKDSKKTPSDKKESSGKGVLTVTIVIIIILVILIIIVMSYLNKVKKERERRARRYKKQAGRRD
ncbi:MAG: hypothetical protein IJ619_04930 [Eubacterium sp.]|nr:hypothetical protein [Eubacterium sp.]